MSARHTPGPWEVSSCHNGSRQSIGVTLPCINGLAARFELAVVYAPDEAEIGYTDGALNHDTAAANARLIEAAPCLAEAATALASDVQDLLDCRNDCGDWGSECPLQDAHKPDSTVDRLQRLLDVLARIEGGDA